MAATIFNEPFLSTDPRHQGLILHTIYHEPNGWDHKPDANKAAHGESCMWGDYLLPLKLRPTKMVALRS
jgi:hypothetical protein